MPDIKSLNQTTRECVIAFDGEDEDLIFRYNPHKLGGKLERKELEMQDK